MIQNKILKGLFNIMMNSSYFLVLIYILGMILKMKKFVIQ